MGPEPERRRRKRKQKKDQPERLAFFVFQRRINVAATPSGNRERAGGWSVRKPVTRKQGARPVRPVRYSLIDLPETPQAEIDVCLACPLPDCGPRGCPLARACPPAKAGK